MAIIGIVGIPSTSNVIVKLDCKIMKETIPPLPVTAGTMSLGRSKLDPGHGIGMNLGKA